MHGSSVHLTLGLVYRKNFLSSVPGDCSVIEIMYVFYSTGIYVLHDADV